MIFSLHQSLKKDLIKLGRLELCHVFLMPNTENPWVVLVPNRMTEEGAYIREVFELSESDQYALTRESSMLAQYMNEQFSADKMNVASLGNMVPQLHIHIICRYSQDTAWPGPIWGKELRRDEAKLNDIKNKLTTYLNRM